MRYRVAQITVRGAGGSDEVLRVYREDNNELSYTLSSGCGILLSLSNLGPCNLPDHADDRTDDDIVSAVRSCLGVRRHTITAVKKFKPPLRTVVVRVEYGRVVSVDTPPGIKCEVRYYGSGSNHHNHHDKTYGNKSYALGPELPPDEEEG